MLARLPERVRDCLNRLVASSGRLSSRQPLQSGSIESGQGEASASVDRLLRVDERCFYIGGWAFDATAPISRLTVVSPEGHRLELLGTAFWHGRPDVVAVYPRAGQKSGFIAHGTLPEPTQLATGWTLELGRQDGTIRRVPVPAAMTDRRAIRDSILADLDLDQSPRAARLLESHIFPAVTRIQEQDARILPDAELIDFGTPEEVPEVSVVVPLYRRLDLLEHQLAQFVDDPHFRRAELLYVLDSPELGEALHELAHQLYQLYRLPFRAMFLDRNVGFALVNNMGIAAARAQRVILLNSDVFPVRPGWTSRLLQLHETLPQVGALAPKLLFEEETIQHAGLYFYRPPGASVWENQHYYKGYHRHLPAANVARPVPAVTAACMMIDRALYLRNGGLSPLYVVGDYEDSDLCLRLRSAGHEIWYTPQVELYHLEGQSYVWQQRVRVSRYNAWVQTHLWGDTIEKVMARFAP